MIGWSSRTLPTDRSSFSNEDGSKAINVAGIQLKADGWRWEEPWIVAADVHLPRTSCELFRRVGIDCNNPGGDEWQKIPGIECEGDLCAFGDDSYSPMPFALRRNRGRVEDQLLNFIGHIGGADMGRTIVFEERNQQRFK
ncbi:unnamed protein product [Nippostrongylus brasiliensis]|uniref:Peptidase A1 domain-containing protein n=1 Tax=Nippostrongylus brasiliensis TaxID=27835 RepID=A0A0N4YGX1_NIPBR|nr:unnamed protein product [Nippostrongylus brasiliensis]